MARLIQTKVQKTSEYVNLFHFKASQRHCFDYANTALGGECEVRWLASGGAFLIGGLVWIIPSLF